MIKLYRYLGDHSWETAEIWVTNDEQTIVHSRFTHPKIKERTYESIVKGTKTLSPKDRSETVVNRKVADMIRKKGWSPNKSEDKPDGELKFSNYDDYKDRLTFPVFVTEKLDGIHADYSDGILMSRGRKEISVPHITEALKGYESLRLSGELYVPGKTLEEIKSMVDHGHPDIEYHLYLDKDRASKSNQSVSYMCLEELVRDIGKESISIVYGKSCGSQSSMDIFYNRVIRYGGEGIVCWSYEALWEPKRSRVILKRKPVYRDELKIKGILYDEDSLGKMIAFDVECTAGSLKVVPKWTKERRVKEYQKDHESIIGRKITVEHRGFTKYGIPKHAKAIDYREDL